MILEFCVYFNSASKWFDHKLFWNNFAGQEWGGCMMSLTDILFHNYKSSTTLLYIYEIRKEMVWLGYSLMSNIQYIPRNMHTVFALLCFVVVIHWLIFPYPSGLLHWHCGNLTIAPVLAKQTWWIWINTSCEFIMNDCITTTKQSTTKPCTYFLGYTVCCHRGLNWTKTSI